MSHLLQDFLTLLNTKRKENESFRNFGNLLPAQIPANNWPGFSIAQHPRKVTLISLSSEILCESYPVSILSDDHVKASSPSLLT